MKDTEPQKFVMPTVARVCAGVVGLVLLALGLFFFFPLQLSEWKRLIGATIAAGLGFDLLVGACRGRWPVAALFWIVP